MSKEYIELPNGVNIRRITDESGTLSIREDNQRIISKDSVILANKMVYVDKDIEKTKKELEDYKGVTFLSKHMLRIQPIIILGITSLAFLFGGISSKGEFLTGGLSSGIQGFASSLLVAGVTTTFYTITNSWAKKKIKGLEYKIEKAEELKDTYLKDFEKELQEENTIVNNMEQVQIVEFNSIVGEIEQETSQIDNVLQEAYKNGHKVKRKVLTRNYNKN